MRLSQGIHQLHFEGPEVWIDGLKRFLQPGPEGIDLKEIAAGDQATGGQSDQPLLLLQNGSREYRLPIGSIRFYWKGPALIRLGKEKKARRLFGDLRLLRRDQAWLPNLHIDIELYLSGILHKEMGAHFPLESLKAQAVAARSYARTCIRRSRSKSFDLYGDSRSQVFFEVSEEPRILEAIRGTLGQLLLYDGQVLRTYYHSTCGGRTRDGFLRFRDVPRDSLPPVVCTHCSASPRYRWTRRVTKQALQGVGIVVRGKGPKIEVLQSAPRGDWQRLRIRGNGRASAPFPASLLRRIGSLPSLWIVEQKFQKGSFLLRGRGFGHGVGLCQWGARGLALLGWNHEEILSFYYPRAKLQKPSE